MTTNKSTKNVVFSPPYTLHGITSISFGFKKLDLEKYKKKLAINKSLKFLTFFSWSPIICVCSKWDPHPLHPVGYNELVISTFTFKKFKLFSVPLDLYLNNDFYVEQGIKYYNLPKYLISDLNFLNTSNGFTLKSNEIDIKLQMSHSLIQLIFMPLKIIIGLLVSSGTWLVPILGIKNKNWIKARITVFPKIFKGYFAKTTHFNTPSINNPFLLSMIWKRSSSTVYQPFSVRSEK